MGRARYYKKPPGWGTAGRPTGAGSRRIQLCLSWGDLEKLHRVRANQGLLHLSTAFRFCLAADLSPTRRNQEIAAGCRARRAGGARINRFRRLSQWLTRADLAILRNIVVVFDFRFLAEAARLAVRAYQEGGNNDS